MFGCLMVIINIFWFYSNYYLKLRIVGNVCYLNDLKVIVMDLKMLRNINGFFQFVLRMDQNIEII